MRKDTHIKTKTLATGIVTVKEPFSKIINVFSHKWSESMDNHDLNSSRERINFYPISKP